MAESSGELSPHPELEIPKQTSEGQEVQAEKALENRTQIETRQARQTPQYSPPSSQKIPVTVDDSSTSTSSQTSKSASSDISALDGDRIEKQWVDRAKAIVAQTQDDPYNQKRQMGRVKADYIKKRFDKTIPADDAVAT